MLIAKFDKKTKKIGEPRRGESTSAAAAPVPNSASTTAARSLQAATHSAGRTSRWYSNVLVLLSLLLLVLQLLLFSQTLGLPTRTGDGPRQQLYYTVVLELARHVNGRAACRYASPPQSALGCAPHVNHLGRSIHQEAHHLQMASAGRGK